MAETGKRVDPFNNFNFLVEIEGIRRAAFQEASAREPAPVDRPAESRLIVERLRRTDSSILRVLETSTPRPVSPVPEIPPRTAPLSLVLQRLREPERTLAVLAERRAFERPADSMSRTRSRGSNLRANVCGCP